MFFPSTTHEAARAPSFEPDQREMCRAAVGGVSLCVPPSRYSHCIMGNVSSTSETLLRPEGAIVASLSQFTPSGLPSSSSKTALLESCRDLLSYFSGSFQSCPASAACRTLFWVRSCPLSPSLSHAFSYTCFCSQRK